MKNLKINLFMAMAAMALTACQKDDVATIDQDGNALPTEMATVRFQMNASALKVPTTRATAQAYTKDGLRILAFRQNDEKNFLYVTDVDKAKIDYSNGKFTGTAQLPVGVYKFIPAYGLPAVDGTDVTIPNPGTTNNITETMNIVHNTGNLPAIFLQENNTDPAPYTLAVNSNETSTVTLNLKRAVARVDVIFVRGTKNAEDKYVELPSSDQVLGVGLDSMGMAFTNINSTVQLVDGGVVANSIFQPSFAPDVTVDAGLVVGTNTTGTTLGTPDGVNAFENVGAAEIAQGGAFVYGPFVFPYENNETTTLTIKVKSKEDPANGQIYRRTITVENVKLVRNQVTLVKIFVPGKDLFHTNTTFDVTINRDWEYNTTSEGEAI